MSLAAGERHQLMMTLDAPSTEVGQGVGPGLRAGRLSNGVHGLFKLLDALDEAGKFGRHARHVGLKVDHALGGLAGSLLASGGVADVSAASRYAIRQALRIELRVGVLHRHEGDAELLGVPLGAREFGPGPYVPAAISARKWAAISRAVGFLFGSDSIPKAYLT